MLQRKLITIPAVLPATTLHPYGCQVLLLGCNLFGTDRMSGKRQPQFSCSCAAESIASLTSVHHSPTGSSQRVAQIVLAKSSGIPFRDRTTFDRCRAQVRLAADRSGTWNPSLLLMLGEEPCTRNRWDSSWCTPGDRSPFTGRWGGHQRSLPWESVREWEATLSDTPEK